MGQDACGACADAFARDLSKLLVSYRFDPRELQEFIRGLFRADYAKEVEDIRACRASFAPPAPPTPAPVAAPVTPQEAPTPPQGHPATPGVTPPLQDDEGKRGLWARIKSKFTK